nr:hypothetical protein [Bacteroides intestinalis]
METKELLEKLVNEVAAQNKLIALLISKEVCISFNDIDFLNEEKFMSLCSERAKYILEKAYSSVS